MAIEFEKDSIDFELFDPEGIRSVINEIAYDHEYQIGDVLYIFCSKERIIDINKDYLNHNYETDIITFPYETDPYIESEIYICIAVVLENAQEYHTSEKDEILRVIFHGILHLVGYDDHNEEDTKAMRAAEEKYIMRYYSLTGL